MKLQFVFACLALFGFLGGSGASQSAPLSGKVTASASRIRTALPAASSTDNYVADMDYAEYWQSKRMPLKVFIHSCAGVNFFDPRFVEVFKTSCDDWSSATDNKIRFEFVDKLDNADLEVKWTANKNNWPVNPHGQEEGVTSVSISGIEGIDHAIVYLLTVDRISGKQLTLRAMGHLCLHEVGHAFGLGHSLKKSDVMYRNMSMAYSMVEGQMKADLCDPNEGQDKLSPRDARTMKTVYDAKNRLDAVRQEGLDKRSACVELVNESAKQINGGDYALAIIYLSEALKVDEKCREAAENLMATYYNCGVDRYNKQQYAQALPLIERSINISRKIGNSAQAAQMSTIYRNCQQSMRL